jgi:uncharacterized protein YndB with AHSA1/START domain
MPKDLIAKAAIAIQSTKDKVWEALVTPAAIKQYMFGADVESDWRAGSAITWKGEWKGKKYEDKGVILRIEPGQTLQYSHSSPMSGTPDRPENYHTVTIRLTGSVATTEVSLSQDNNADEKARQDSEKNWKGMLERLKDYLENSSSGSRRTP